MKEHGVIAIIKKHVLTAIGYMIPLVVAAGLCMALGQLLTEMFVILHQVLAGICIKPVALECRQ